MDFARRAYDHSFHFDPIVRSLLATDFYKFLMMQYIQKFHPKVEVVFELIVRKKGISLANIISEQEFHQQLDHARSLKFTKTQLIYLTGNTFYGQKNMFCPEFIEYLRNYSLPDYSLEITQDRDYKLRFKGNWLDVTLWEIVAMQITNVLRNRAMMKSMNKFELECLYVDAKNRLIQDLKCLKAYGVGGVADFGTRRCHDFLWHKYAVEAAREILGEGFVGTSNVELAMQLDLEAIGTNAHETRMVQAALANTDEELLNSPYVFDKQWADLYSGNLLVMLPDTYGSTAYFEHAPEFLNDFTAVRLDSKNPYLAADEYISWLKSRNIDPRTRRIIPSDGLTPDIMVKLWSHYRHEINVSFGWGTYLTNNFLHPVNPISIVCKIVEVNGRPAVKLSDVKSKRTGNFDEIARYVRVFGEKGIEDGNTPTV